jgi:hypothetical protein
MITNMKIIIVHSLILVTIFLSSFSFSSSLSLFINTDAQLKPNAIVSPGCGDVTGYEINLNINGFEPDSNVSWKLVNPATQTTSEYDYFSTNSTAGFSEPAFIEEEGLVEGKYDIQFFDDADTDGNPDPGKKEFIVSMSVPCEEE